MNEDKIIEFLEDFNAKAEKLSEVERIDLLTDMLLEFSDEEQDAILNYCSDAYDEEEECDCCDCEEETEDEEDNDEMKELKIYEKELEVKASELALQEELKRIENLDNEFIIPQYIKDSELFKRVEIECASITHSFRMLLKAGIDYQNALQIAQNSVTSYNNKEMTKIQGVQSSMSQI